MSSIWGEGLEGARPVAAPSPKSEILERASIESLWSAAPPRLSPTLPEASSERAHNFPTLNGTGQPGVAGGDFA